MRNAGEVYVGPYILQDTIGVGTTGKVKAGFHKQTGQRVAVKIVKKKNMEDNLEVRQRVEREVKVLKLLNHPNVMKLYDVLQTSTHLFVVVELLEGGQLYDHVSAHPLLGEAEVFQFFYQLTTGIAFMHSQNICHRNVKLENLLLDAAGNLKIADLEMASAIPRGRYLETSCGSPHYACPEIVKNERYVWIRRMLFFLLLCVVLSCVLILFLGGPHLARARARAAHQQPSHTARHRCRRVVVRGVAVRADDEHPSFRRAERRSAVCQNQSRAVPHAVRHLAVSAGPPRSHACGEGRRTHYDGRNSAYVQTSKQESGTGGR